MSKTTLCMMTFRILCFTPRKNYAKHKDTKLNDNRKSDNKQNFTEQIDINKNANKQNNKHAE